MKAADYFLAVAAIWLSPHVSKWYGFAMGFVYFGLAVMALCFSRKRQ